MVVICFCVLFDALFSEGSFAYVGWTVFSLTFASPEFCQGVLSMTVGLVRAA